MAGPVIKRRAADGGGAGSGVDHDVVGGYATGEEVGVVEHAGDDGCICFVGVGDESCPYCEQMADFERVLGCGEVELQLRGRNISEGKYIVKGERTEIAAESSFRSI